MTKWGVERLHKWRVVKYLDLEEVCKVPRTAQGLSARRAAKICTAMYKELLFPNDLSENKSTSEVAWPKPIWFLSQEGALDLAIDTYMFLNATVGRG